MNINNNFAYNKQKISQPDFKGFFKLSDSRIKVFLKNGDICANEFGTNVMKNWGIAFPKYDANAFLTLGAKKPMYIICDNFMDLPIMLWLKEHSIKFSAKKLSSIEDMFKLNSKDFETAFKNIPEKLSEKMFLN